MATAFQLIPQTPSAAPKWYDAELGKLHAAIDRKLRFVDPEEDRYGKLSAVMDLIEEADCLLDDAGGLDA